MNFQNIKSHGKPKKVIITDWVIMNRHVPYIIWRNNKLLQQTGCNAACKKLNIVMSQIQSTNIKNFHNGRDDTPKKSHSKCNVSAIRGALTL